MDEQKTEVLPEEAPSPEKKPTLKEYLYEAFEEVCTVTAIVILLFMFVGRMATVSGDSMTNTLFHGDRVVMTNLFYDPKPMDIVVVAKEDGYFKDSLIIKRIIAEEGDVVHIDFENWTVTVNGEMLTELYIRYEAGDMDREDMRSNTFVVPEGCYFVMGDNRNGSTDSRSDHVGYVKESEIMGKAIFRLFPFDSIGVVK